MKRSGNKKANIYGDENAPVYRPMADIMKVDFVYNKDGDVWILHDKPLPGKLEWVEYDADLETVTLVTDVGKIQDLGLIVPSQRGKQMLSANDITAMLMEDGKVTDFSIVPIVVRNTAVN